MFVYLPQHECAKANFCPVILRILLNTGAYIDAVSPAEVFLALKIGFAPSRILFTVNNATGRFQTYKCVKR